MPQIPHEKYNATLVARTDVTSGLRILWVQPDQPFQPYLAGQYVALGLSGETPRASDQPETRVPRPQQIVSRSYSIASAGYENEVLEFFIARVPHGSLTPRLWTLEVGHRLAIGPRIVGSFTLESARTDTAVLVGTGTGIAPYVSILRQHLAKRPDRRFVLLHGATQRKELAYLPEFRAMAHAHANFTYIPAISRPHLDPTWKGVTGRLTTFFAAEGELLRRLTGIGLDPARADFYLCGNPGMIAEIDSVLEGKGYLTRSKDGPASLHIEEFWREKGEKE